MSAQWPIGKYVWAMWGKTYWPGMVVRKQDAHIYGEALDTVVIYWFGDHRVSKVNHNNLSDFAENFKIHYNDKLKGTIAQTRLSGIYEAIKQYGDPATETMSNAELIEFATNGFPNCVHDETALSEDVKLEMQHKDLKTFVPLNITKNTASLQEAIKRGEYEKNICLACYTHQITDIEHPLFRGKLCQHCSDRLKATYFVVEKDETESIQNPKHKHCIVCGDFCNSTIYCSSAKCKRKYCTQCVRNFEIDCDFITNPKWLCIVCDPDQLNSLLQIQDNIDYRLQSFLSHLDGTKEIVKIPSLLKTVSTFYGQSQVIQSLFEDFKNYLYRVRDDADQVLGFTNMISYTFEYLKIYFIKPEDEDIQFFSVRRLHPPDVNQFGPHLLLGGTSMDNLGLHSKDENGLMMLFHQFYRFQQWYTIFNPDSFYWAFEVGCTVTQMERVSISRLLECDPNLVTVKKANEEDYNYLLWSNFPKHILI